MDPYKGEAEEKLTQTHRGGNVTTEAETGERPLPAEECWQQPGAGRGKENSPLGHISPTGWSMDLQTPGFWPSDTDFRLLASRTLEE